MNAIRDVFLAALDRPPSEWDTFLDSACGTDLDLRRRVAELLAAHARPDPLLDRPAAAAVALTDGGDPFPDNSLHYLTPTDVPGAVGRLGHYTVFEVIGRGGMGVVFRAFDEKLHRDVAVKVLPPALAVEESARRRFVREARAAAAVRHENVVPIHAVEDGDPVPYLVMACVDGGTLQDRIDGGPPLTVTDILRIGARVADGLAAAHRQGLVHRDVKPANILLDAESGRPLLTDFGLARATDNPALTRNGQIAGTPQYMSPEQVNGERVGPRSDLFSLGGVLYAMCTGQPPFRAETTVGVLRKVSDEPAPSLDGATPAVPRRLREIIARLLAKKPGERFDLAEDVAAALDALSADLAAGRDTDRAPRHRLTRRRLVIGIPLAAAAVAAASLAFRPRERPELPPDPPPPKPEWTSLFNGTDLTGWRVDPSAQGQWTVEEGEIVTRRGSVVPILTERDDYANFHLRLRLRPVGDGSAGIHFRQGRASVEMDEHYATGFWFRHPKMSGIELTGGSIELVSNPRKGRLGLGPVRQFESGGSVPTDDPWPLVEIVCQGERLRILACGKTLTDVKRSPPKRLRGAIGLKAIAYRPNTLLDVRFKDIEIKELPPG